MDFSLTLVVSGLAPGSLDRAGHVHHWHRVPPSVAGRSDDSSGRSGQRGRRRAMGDRLLPYPPCRGAIVGVSLAAAAFEG
jgi:hypothetical protein